MDCRNAVDIIEIVEPIAIDNASTNNMCNFQIHQGKRI